MATRRTIKKQANKTEVNVQQYLFPGTEFAGHAKRPAHEDEDICGQGWSGWWWGECKNYSKDTINAKGGSYLVLLDAYNQCVDAIERNMHVWINYIPQGDDPAVIDEPTPFSCLWPKGSRKDEQKLVMVKQNNMMVIICLRDFRDKYIIGLDNDRYVEINVGEYVKLNEDDNELYERKGK